MDQSSSKALRIKHLFAFYGTGTFVTSSQEATTDACPSMNPNPNLLS
jgi:hypothetical protein